MDEYMGTIKYFAFGYAPTGWLPCNGQLLSISQYTALYALIGINYGGNGSTTFAIPTITTKLGTITSPAIGYCICVNGLYPSRP